MAVYNAERYLKESVASLKRQTVSDFECVCVDDASTDSSPAMLDEIAAGDNRFRIVHLQKNQGPAHARNVALAVSHGELVTMLDADDWLSENALQEAVNTFSEHPQTDCVLFDLLFAYADGTVKEYDWHYGGNGPFEIMTGREAFLATLDWGIHGVYMARRSLYDRWPYDESLPSYSDDNTTRIHYLHSQEVRCCRGRYYYRQHDNSVTTRVDVKRMNWMEAMAQLKSGLIAIGEPEDVLTRVEQQRWRVVIDSYWFVYTHRNKFAGEDRRRCMALIEKNYRSMEWWRLPARWSLRPGLWHLGGCWRAFRVAEKIYFLLRTFAGRK